MNVFLFILIIVLDILGIIQIINAKKADRELPKDVLDFDLEYFREVISKDSTVGELGFLYNTAGEDYGRTEYFVLSGVILNIALKEWIDITKMENDLLRFHINERGKEELSNDEKIVYEYLCKIPNQNGYYTIEDYWNYDMEDPNIRREMISEFRETIEQRVIDAGKYKYEKDLKRKKFYMYSSFNVAAIYFAMVLTVESAKTMTVYGLINVISVMIMMLIYMLATVYNTKVSKVATNFTKKGLEEYELLDGLRNYFKDYTSISEQGVEYLPLLKENLVYATILGVADKVVKQLFSGKN